MNHDAAIESLNPVGGLALRFAFLIPWSYAFVGSQFLGAYLQRVEVKK